jgi:hypothetical protein
MPVPKQAAQDAMTAAPAVCCCASTVAHRCTERLILRVLVGSLLAFVHLLLERLGFFLIAERQTC